MSTNSFILVLMRKMALSIAVIGMVISCRSKTSDSETEGVVSKNQSGGRKENMEDRYDNDIDFSKEKNAGSSKKEVETTIHKDSDGKVKKIVKKETHKTPEGKTKIVTKTTEKKDDTNETEVVDSNKEKQEEEASNDEETANIENEEDEEESENIEDSENEKVMSQEEKTFGIDECPVKGPYWPWHWKLFGYRKRSTICTWPKNYELSLPHPIPMCCKEASKKARKAGEKSFETPVLAQEIAVKTGAFSNPTSSSTCNIREIQVKSIKNGSKKAFKWGWFRRCRTHCRTRAKDCGYTCKRLDRFALLSFNKKVSKSFMNHAWLRWDDPCCELLNKLNDRRCSKKEYPKIGMDLVARVEFLFDPNLDPCDKDGKKYTYRIKSNHLALLDCLTSCAKKIKKTVTKDTLDQNGKKCCKEFEYPVYETLVMPFCYVGYNKTEKWKWMNKFRSRNAFLFYAVDGGNECKKPCQVYDCNTCSPCNTCEEGEGEETKEDKKDGYVEITDKGMNWGTYMKLRNKGVNACKGYKKFHPSIFRSPTRAIYIEKYDCGGNKIKVQCLARISFVYKIQLWSEKGEEPIIYETDAVHN